MTTWVALLRGINVGGNHRLPMASLVALLTDLGAGDVRTYIQSGNVVFTAGAREGEAMGGRLRDAIQEAHGFAPHVLVRRAAALERVIERNPYPGAAAEPKTLHVYFLDTKPPAPDVDGLEAIRGEHESFELDGDVLYLHLPDGLGRSTLAARAEKLVGVPATARNWSTVTKLAGLAASAPD